MLTFLLLMDLRVIAYYEHHHDLCVWINDVSTFRSGPRAEFHIEIYLAFGAVFAKLASSCLGHQNDLGARHSNSQPPPNVAISTSIKVQLHMLVVLSESVTPPYGMW